MNDDQLAVEDALDIAWAVALRNPVAATFERGLVDDAWETVDRHRQANADRASSPRELVAV
jgi:hypothetical protein